MIDWKHETIFVTGGCGLIGSHLAEELQSRGARDIRIVDDLSRGSLDNLHNLRNFRLIETDLERDVPQFFAGSIVLHLASVVAGIDYNDAHQFSMLRRNSLIHLNVGEAVRRYKPKFYFYTSTACVYPSSAIVPTPESCGDTLDPEKSNWGYGAAKWIGEKATQIIARDHGVPSLCGRFFNAIGSRDHYDELTAHVIPALIRRVLSGENPLTVWGDGTASRVFVDAKDIAYCICELVENCHDDTTMNWGAPVNLGHDDEIRIADLARLVTKYCGVPDLPIVFDSTKPNGYQRRASDHTLLDQLIGLHDYIPLETSLENMIADYRERYGVHSLDRATA